MKLNKLLIGIGIGFTCGLFLKTKNDNRSLSPEKVLSMVKDSLKKEGMIDGSWIHMIPETVEKDHHTYTVFRGGVSKKTDNKTQQLEFTADAGTAMIIEVHETKQPAL